MYAIRSYYGILHVEAGHDLRLALGHVEGRAVGLGHAGDEVDHEQRQQRQPEPVEQAPVLTSYSIHYTKLYEMESIHRHVGM